MKGSDSLRDALRLYRRMMGYGSEWEWYAHVVSLLPGTDNRVDSLGWDTVYDVMLVYRDAPLAFAHVGEYLSPLLSVSGRYWWWQARERLLALSDSAKKVWAEYVNWLLVTPACDWDILPYVGLVYLEGRLGDWHRLAHWVSCRHRGRGGRKIVSRVFDWFERYLGVTLSYPEDEWDTYFWADERGVLLMESSVLCEWTRVKVLERTDAYNRAGMDYGDALKRAAREMGLRRW